jgi:hypothetical protein
MPVEAALALLGLYLRARDDFTLRRLPGFRETLGRGLFYWVLARELLPNAWRSTSAGVQHKQATGDDRVLQLFMSAITRLDRALRSRDRLHHQMKLEQNNDTADEALFFLDTFLVFLVAGLRRRRPRRPPHLRPGCQQAPRGELAAPVAHQATCSGGGQPCPAHGRRHTRPRHPRPGGAFA